MVIRVDETKAPPFMAVKRISIKDLSDANVDMVLSGSEPIIIEDIAEEWPDKLQKMTLEEMLVFKEEPESVHINGVQQFGISPEEILERLKAGEDCRVFGARLSDELSSSCVNPPFLFSHLKLFRYDDPKPQFFIGGRGGVTLLHHDFEQNANWHIALHGKRRVYLWTSDESPNLFKLPIIGLSPIPLAKGYLDFRFARGYECELSKGELLYMPPKCWHQVEYTERSVAVTFAFYTSPLAKSFGTCIGRFWLGFMSFTQAVQARKFAGLAAFPLMIPLAIFSGFYMSLVFLAHKFLGRLSFLVIVPIRMVEVLLFLLYWPLMTLFRTRMWVGY
jgi:hypothetical protein